MQEKSEGSRIEGGSSRQGLASLNMPARSRADPLQSCAAVRTFRNRAARAERRAPRRLKCTATLYKLVDRYTSSLAKLYPTAVLRETLHSTRPSLVSLLFSSRRNRCSPLHCRTSEAEAIKSIMAACSAMTTRYTSFLPARRKCCALIRSRRRRLLWATISEAAIINGCGGVLGNDGKIYGIPSFASKVLCFDPVAATATLVGDDLGSGGAKWCGGVLGNDKKIYGIPASASHVLCYDPIAATATLVGDDLGSGGGSKWNGGVLGPDGKIYGIPCDASHVLCFDPNTQTATLVGDDLGSGGGKWVGGVLGNDNKIYGIPRDASKVLCYDPVARRRLLWATISEAAIINGLAACSAMTTRSTAFLATPRKCCALTRLRRRRLSWATTSEAAVVNGLAACSAMTARSSTASLARLTGAVR